jgi:hypothetical protein
LELSQLGSRGRSPHPQLIGYPFAIEVRVSPGLCSEKFHVTHSSAH